MKYLIAFCSILSLSALSTFAQGRYESITLISGLTVPASGTSNYTAVVNCRLANTVGVTTTSALSGSGTDAIIWSFSKSTDGSVFETTPSVTITNTSNGTTPVIVYSEIAVAGVQTLKLVSVVNASSSRVLTNTVTVGVKNRFTN